MPDKIIMEVPYFQTPNNIFEIGLNNYELCAYMYLCRCGNNGGTAFPSYQTIADKCGMSKRKAMDTVKSLVDKKLLYKQIRYNKEAKENYSNIYTVNLNIGGSAQHALGSEYSAPGSAEHAPYKEPYYKEPNIKILNGATEDSSALFFYFIEAYKAYRGEEHPIVNGKELERVLKQLEEYEYEDEIQMIDKYFTTNFKIKTNYQIWHYLSEGIRELRMYETIH